MPTVTTEKWPKESFDILLGDFNAHSSIWCKDDQTDQRGEMVIDYLLENDMATINDGRPTFVDKGKDNVETGPDISIVHSRKMDMFEWDVRDEFPEGHKPIIIDMKLDQKIPKV